MIEVYKIIHGKYDKTCGNFCWNILASSDNFLRRKNDINQRYRRMLQDMRRWRVNFCFKENSHVNLSNLAIYRGIAYDVITVLTVH